MRLISGTALLLIGWAYFLVTAWYPDVDWLQNDLVRVGWPAVLTLLGLLALAGAGFIRPNDPGLAGWAVFALVGSLLVAPLIPAKMIQEGMDAERTEEIVALRRALNLELRRQQQALREELARYRANRPVDRFTQYEGRVPLQTLIAVRELDDEMQTMLQERADAYKRAMDENPVLGPSAWVTFRSLEELEIERSAHQRLYEATRAFTQFIEPFEAVYTARIESLDLPPPGDRIAIAEMIRIIQLWEQDNTFLLRKLDEEMLASALTALNVLHEDWEKWTYNPREEALTFQNPDSEFRFHEAIQRFQNAFKAVQDLQEKRPASPGQ